MQTLFKIIFFTFLSVLLLACSQNKAELTSSTNTKQPVKEITVNDLTENTLDKYLIIDVRESNELKVGMIPKAIHIPMGQIASELPAFLEKNNKNQSLSELKNKPILLYCGSGKRSYTSAETLQKLGFTNLTSLDGGFNAYNAMSK